LEIINTLQGIEIGDGREMIWEEGEGERD